MFVAAGSSAENYLRYAATLLDSAPPPASIRPFSPGELAGMSGSGCSSFIAGRHALHRRGGLEWQVVSPATTLWYNSTYPFGWNDGAVWRGRGATVAAEGGVSLRWGPLSASLAPLAFVAENRDFALMPNNDTLASIFADPRQPERIDRPQRFGANSYGRLDPGQSTIRLDALGVGLGLSTENLWIGPMSEWPFLLSNNAPGFPHVFAGSSRPWNIGVGRIHGRVFYGKLTESDYTNIPDSASRRFTSGVEGTFEPSFIRGLEIGAARMFEYIDRGNGFGWADLRKPFEAFLKEHVTGDPGKPNNDSADNQLASAFARWVAPANGFEIYGEFSRDDHNWNARDAIVEPDHAAAYGFGLRKAWSRADSGITGLRMEVLSFDPSILFRSGRAQNLKYSHHATRQGHTERGQILGAGFAALDGGGSMLALERFGRGGEMSSYSISRLVLREQTSDPSVDVAYALAAERTRSLGGKVLVTWGVTGVIELNRYFAADVGNVMLTSGVRW